MTRVHVANARKQRTAPEVMEAAARMVTAVRTAYPADSVYRLHPNHDEDASQLQIILQIVGATFVSVTENAEERDTPVDLASVAIGFGTGFGLLLRLIGRDPTHERLPECVSLLVQSVVMAACANIDPHRPDA